MHFLRRGRRCSGAGGAGGESPPRYAICDRTELLARGVSDTGTEVPFAARCLLRGLGNSRGGNPYGAVTSECENPNMNGSIISDIVTFWLSDSREDPHRALARRDWWYAGGPAVDEEIRARFGDLVPRACARGLMGWRDTPDGALALILLLDQFTRNLYRGTVEAYAGDPAAFEVVNHAIDRRHDRELHPVATVWLYHPFHHSEDVTEQDRGLVLLRDLRQRANPAWRAYVERSIKGWTRHRDIVGRFGRFPHRNAVLGRRSTTEELEYLATDGNSFGQGPPTSSATC